MRPFDEWTDDLPDVIDSRQQGLPFDGSQAAASTEESETAKPAIGRPPLEELFDAFARGEEVPANMPQSPLPSQAIVETEVVSLPVALVLQPRESVALVAIQATPALKLSAADVSPWNQPVPVEVVSSEASVGEAVEPTVVMPAVVAVSAVAESAVAESPVIESAVAESAAADFAVAASTAAEAAIADFLRAESTLATPEVKAVKTEIVEESAPWEPVASVPVVAEVVERKPVAADPVVVKPAIVDPPVFRPPVARVPPMPKFEQPVPAPAAIVSPAAIAVKPPITIKIKETPKVEFAPESVAHIPAPVVVATQPKPSSGMGRYLAAAAAIIVIVGAIGIPMGRLWATRRAEPVATSQPQARVAAPTPQPREKRAEPVSVPIPTTVPFSTSITERVTAAAPASSAAASVVAPKPKASVPVAPAASQPTIALPTLPVAPPTVSVATATAVAEPVPVAPAPVAAPSPGPAPPVAVPSAEMLQPVGPFFEMAQVDKAPRVSTRVDPQLPSGTQSKAGDIALVRVLVSQAGHPVLVRMLRPSKGGLASDDAVIAAVKKWTFTPAVKKGETVTCWLHVAVPLH